MTTTYISNRTIPDVSATAFLTAANITNPIERAAIYDLVKGLKLNNLWSKLRVVYPFVGSNEFSHRFNLLDPRQIDSAFYLTPGSTPTTHTSYGIGFSGVNEQMWLTHFVPSNELGATNHIALYTSGEEAGGVTVDFGCIITGSGILFDLLPTISGRAYFENSDGSMLSAPVPNALGFTVGTRTGTTEASLYKHGALLASNTALNQGYPLIQMGLGNRNGEVAYPSSRTYSYASVGDGLSAAEVAIYNTVVSNFQEKLTRNPFTQAL